MNFKDRADAGKQLAETLTHYSGERNAFVLALPRGGVPVAYEVAIQLHLPLDIFLVRKLGFPGQPELAMGAIASGGTRILNEDLIRSGRIPQHIIEAVTEQEAHELQRREQVYRSGRAALEVTGKTIILIDDGLATGASMRAAITALRQQQPNGVIVAVPVASKEVCHEFQQYADVVVCVMTPQPFYGVGRWYNDFSQTTDNEVQQLLQKASIREIT